MNISATSSLDPRALLRTLTGIVVLATVSAIVTIGAVTWSSSADEVSAVEVNLAGKQRRLSERAAYDVARVRLDPARDDVRTELRRVGERIRAIRTGLLDGDATLGLDGTVPGSVRTLYSAAGLDLSRRLEHYEAAIATIADTPGPPPAEAIDVIDREANGERLVRDLDMVVSALTTAHEQRFAGRHRASLLGFGVVAVLGVASIVALLSIRRRIQRQFDDHAELVGEVRDSEELYRTTVDSLVDGVVIIDETGSVVRVNEAAREIFASTFDGASPRTGEDFAGFLPQMLREDGLPFEHGDRPVVRALRESEPVVGLVAALPGGDRRRWFRCNAAATDGRDGQGRLVVLTFAEITTEREMAARLSDQEQRFRLALEHAPIGMALVSLDGAYLTVNSALCELTGYTEEELAGMGAFGLAHPDDPPVSRGDLEALVAGERDVVSVERRLVAADGSTVHAHIAMSIVRPDAETEPYFIVDYLDVTETTRAIRAQRAALAKEQAMVAKLLELDNTRTTFLSTVSHELRTPLTSMVGYLEMLTDGTAGEMSDAQRSMLDAATRNGLRLRRLIDDLLTLAAAEHQEEAPRDAAVDVADLVAGLIETLSPLAHDGGVSLSAELDADIGAVLGNRSEVERVLINIVGNAVKFTPAGGSVHVRAHRRSEPSPMVELTVSDTGVGIPEHEQDDLFSPFVRARNARANHVPGTGLGLAIAARLVEVHHGWIELESEEGVGTRVTMALPVVDASDPVGAAAR